jgi:hypothetical protein
VKASLLNREIPKPTVTEKGTRACRDLDPDMFFPTKNSALHAKPNKAERDALQVCAGCPVKDWCLAREMAECTVSSSIAGVRGGLRQADRRALYRALAKRGQQ